MGIKRPAGLGQATRDCWPELWPANAPIYQRVLAGETVMCEDALYPISRRGDREDAWFTLSIRARRGRAGYQRGDYGTEVRRSCLIGQVVLPIYPTLVT